VDDKIIARAQQEGVSSQEIAERYVEAAEEDMKALGCIPPTYQPKVTQHISDIIALVQKLVDTGHAYESAGDVYFSVESFPRYGEFSRRNLDDLRAGARIKISDLKRNPLDFALWKKSKPNEPSWESPWGEGRPGWHIECSAMGMRYLGETFDIHGGGADLIFPHHENEIAQSEAATGKTFARYWMHNGMLQWGGEKMSKSLGNVVTIDDFLAEHDPDVLRMVILSTHYRSPLTFNDEVVENAERAWRRLLGALQPSRGKAYDGPAADALREQTESAVAKFEAAMDDDFNTAAALGHLFDLARGLNQARDAGLAGPAFSDARETLRSLGRLLGLRLRPLQRRAEGRDVAPFVELLVQVRSDLRSAREWDLADRIRDGLRGLGVTLKDGPEGTVWEID
jgi:cysteinyl-tRNA synthetase